jgi:RNA polymerase sigma-70 factor (ECF subfamily)
MLGAVMPIESARAAPDEIERIFRDNYGMVFRAAYRITGNASDAEDVLQTVFLRLVRRDASAEAVENVAGYLHRAAINSALDLMRSRAGMRSVPLDDVAPLLSENASLAPDRKHSSAEAREWLRGAIARLSPQAAEIFTLRFFEGKDNAEIAAIVGTTPGTVAVTLSRTRDRLEKEFRAYQGEKS